MSNAAGIAKSRAIARMRQQARDLLDIANRAFASGFYADGARAAQHLKHVFECLSENEAEIEECR